MNSFINLQQKTSQVNFLWSKTDDEWLLIAISVRLFISKKNAHSDAYILNYLFADVIQHQPTFVGRSKIYTVCEIIEGNKHKNLHKNLHVRCK